MMRINGGLIYAVIEAEGGQKVPIGLPPGVLPCEMAFRRASPEESGRFGGARYIAERHSFELLEDPYK